MLVFSKILYTFSIITNNRSKLLEKTLMPGKIEGRRRRGWQRMRWLDVSLTQWAWVWASSGSWWWTGKPGMLQSTGSQRVERDSMNWTELNRFKECLKVVNVLPDSLPHIHLMITRLARRLLFPGKTCLTARSVLFSHSVVSDS